MALTIDNLEIQIETNATKAQSGLDSLAASLAKLKTAVGDTSGLATNLKDIATALQTFSSVGKVRMTVPINQLKKLESVIPILGSAQATQMADNLKKIADSIATFSATAGVGKQMKDAAKGMDALAKSSQRFQTATKTANDANKGTLFSLSQFVNQYRRLYQAIDKVVDVCADWFNESNEYVEALNLFKVSMGDASDAALKYAETVSDAMGIDPAEWITNQGTFQRMSTGFGIASEEAEIMSQNLTQLAYDLSSFFNTDVTTAMQKLQSGMSGQIKGLKAWGYNLSVAALQETALSLGIEESVRNMSEAQKAQLRYITLIQKSKGIMGDMAKTINTPANAMRVLDAQMTQLKRSLGNLVSIIATRVIPYIQAFVEVMAEAAAALAESWGFEIEDLPTNNLEMASDVIDSVGDDVDNTSDAVAELKKQLAGFDELNILKSDDGNDKGEAQNSLNIDLPEYDFLSNLDQKTREKIEEIKKQINDLLPILKGLAKAFAIAFAVKTFNDAKTALAKFFTQTDAGVYIAVTAMEAFDKFKDVLKKTKNPLKALGSAGKQVWTNFKGIMSSLSPLAKTLVSVVALGVEFAVVKENVKGLADGSKEWGDALLAIIPTCGLVGVAMYAMLGPWGLVAAAVVGASAALVGFAEAEKEMRKQFVNDTFYDNYGTKVGDLADKFDELLTSSQGAFDLILEKQSDIDAVKGKIADTKTEVALLISEVTNGATSIEDAIPRITTAFQSLYTDTKDYLIGTASLLYAALTGTTLEGVEEYMRTIAAVTDKTLGEIDASMSRIEEAKKQYEEGTITSKQYWDIYLKETLNISEYSSVEDNLSDIVSGATSKVSDLFADGIDWKSDNLFGDLSAITNAATDAKKTITDAYQSVYDGIAEMRRNAEKQGDVEAVLNFDKMLEDFKALENVDLSKVDNMLNSVVYGLQEDLANAMKEEYDTAIKDYEDLNWFQKLFYGFDAGAYASDRLKDFKEVVAPVIDDLKKVFGEDSIFVDDVIKNTFGGKAFADFTSYATSGDELGITEAFEEAGRDSANGLLLGLSEKQTEVYNESRAMGLSVLEAYDEALGIHSPSIEMEKRGKHTIQGLVNGLSDTTLLSLAIDGIVEKFDILPEVKKLWDRVAKWWEGISLPDLNLLSNIGAKISGIFNVGQYASGGFPSVGEMFIANEGGPELVGRIGNKSAVANNDQIITGIASAVYSAMMAAQEDGNNGESGSARIVVQIGDQAVGEASVRYINGKIVQTGTSPIYS